MRQAQSILYAITNRRAIKLTTFGSRKLFSFGPEHLGLLAVRSLGNGYGDVRIGAIQYHDEEGSLRKEFVWFVGIADPQACAELLSNPLPEEPAGVNEQELG